MPASPGLAAEEDESAVPVVDDPLVVDQRAP